MSLYRAAFGDDGDTQTAADDLIASPPADKKINPLVIAFQKAYKAAGNAIKVDGEYGPLTAKAVSSYGTPPPVPTAGYGIVGTVQGSGIPGGGEVPCIITHAAPEALLSALSAAWPTVVAGPIVPIALQMLLAQSAYETAAWKGCRNWNFGNVKASKGDDWFWMADDCKDLRGDPTECKFKSYPSLEEGAATYLKFMVKNYAPAWPYALSGDTDGFVQALKAHSYFSSPDVDGYKAGVQNFFNRYASLVPSSSGIKETVKQAASVVTGIPVAVFDIPASIPTTAFQAPPEEVRGGFNLAKVFGLAIAAFVGVKVYQGRKALSKSIKK